MNKKGESISMSVIIIAAIALLVLVVLAVLVLRTGKGVGDGTGCQGVGGNCGDRYSDEQACPDGYSYDITKSGKLGGCKTEEVCCVRIANLQED
jgi:hypothetical protein